MIETYADDVHCGHNSLCRKRVEMIMREMIIRLETEGFSRPEIALCLADASEDYVIRLASEIDHMH